MMTGLIFLLYAIIIIMFVVTYFFIIYHLVRYSLKPSLNNIVLPIFIIGSTLLLISNVALFFSVNWQIFLANFPINLR
ncbi:MAG: hypothetical protein WCV59_02015 [Parcubacteria group bacterium]